MSKNIILIDKRVQSYETIISAVNNDICIPIQFDYYADTIEDIKSRIMSEVSTSTLDSNAVRCIGLVQHNYNLPFYRLVGTTNNETPGCIVVGVEVQDPTLETWSEFRDFIIWCKNTPEIRAAHFDMMACALYSDHNWKYIIDTLTVKTGVTIRASTDDTGAASLGGDWFLESHTGINLKTVYFTELIEEYMGILYKTFVRSNQNYSTKGLAESSVVMWGDNGFTVVPSNSNIISVYGTRGMIASLLTNGTILTWQPSTVPSVSNAISICSGGGGFAALTNVGTVISWVHPAYTPLTVPNSVTAANSGVIAVYSTSSAFAALKGNGTVVAWGDSSNGGSAPSSVTDPNSDVVTIYNNDYTFSALKRNGSVITWGGVNSSSNYFSGIGLSSLSSGVIVVYSNRYAFAALKTDGSIVAWGSGDYGGAISGSISGLTSGVISVYSNSSAFAALKTDGSVVAWGYATSGGTTPAGVSSDVVNIYSTDYAFAALKTDGSVVAWGDTGYGGTTAPSSVTAANSGVIAIYATESAFAALKSNGSVITWGNEGYSPSAGNSSSVSGSLTSGVVSICSTKRAFAALKNDGSVIYWGKFGYYEPSNPPVGSLTSGIINIYPIYAEGNSSEGNSFVALKTTATTFDLSMSYYTSADRYDILRKKENRRRVNLKTLNNNVFTLSAASDIQVFNPNIPTSNILRIIVPDYAASSYSITSTATIPSGAGNFIIACDESEHVTISGTTYVNYGTYVYKRETNNIYTKTTSATINGTLYNLYGGDGIFSSGIALVEPPKPIPLLSTFVVEPSKTFGDASFAIVTRPTSESSGAITYSSSNIAVATIDASGNWITLVAAGDVSFNATQAATDQYSAATKASNTLTVARGISNLSSSSTFTVAETKTFGDASFAITTRPTSNSAGVITYSSSNTSVATIDASGNFITLVGAGDVSFNATQAATAQYASATKASNTLTVARGISNLSSSSTFTVESSKTFGDASFAITTQPTSNSTGAITYSSSNPDVATIDASGNWITLVGVGDVSFNATQAQTAQYLSATKASNTLTVSKATPTLAFVSPPTTKTLTDAAFTVVASSASSGAVTYSSNNTAFATVGASTGLVTLKAAGTVTITAAQAASALYNAPANTTCSIVISAAGYELAGQTIIPGTSFAGLNLSGASLVGTTLSGVSFSGATLTNVDFSGAIIIGTDFTNANISSATNLPEFSTVQKLQLLKNINNAAIEAVQVTATVAGSVINLLLAAPISRVAESTFTIKSPSTVDASANKVVTVNSFDISGGKSVYIPMNANETVKINNVVYSFNGINMLDSSGNIVRFASFSETPFKIYAGSIVAVNIKDSLNKFTVLGDGLYDILFSIFSSKFITKT